MISTAKKFLKIGRLIDQTDSGGCIIRAVADLSYVLD